MNLEEDKQPLEEEKQPIRGILSKAGKKPNPVDAFLRNQVSLKLFIKHRTGVTVLFTSHVDTYGKRYGARLMLESLKTYLELDNEKLSCELFGTIHGKKSRLNLSRDVSAQILTEMVREKYDDGGILIAPVVYEHRD